jgi:ubiquinone/menaquinone biosynthesis C-methylase UbiE
MGLATEYDKWHTRVFESDPGHADESSPWYQIVLEYLPSVDGRRVLEIACGRGGFSRLLGERGASVCGADFSASAVAIAKERLRSYPTLNGNVSYVQADAQALPFEDNSFDVVISCETIEHVPDPRAALREMYRVAKPGGSLFLTTPNYFNFTGLYLMYAAVRRPALKSSQPFDQRFLFPQIRRFVTAAGWKIVRSDGTVHQFPFIPGRDPVRVQSLESGRALRRLLHFFALHYLVIGRKPGPAR